MKSKPLTAVFCLLLAACTVIAQPSKNQFPRSQKESKVMTDKADYRQRTTPADHIRIT